jgi:hypothetical protein
MRTGSLRMRTPPGNRSDRRRARGLPQIARAAARRARGEAAHHAWQ